MGAVREAFLSALPATLRQQANGWSDLDEGLLRLLEGSRRPPTQDVDDMQFVAHVARQLPEDGRFPDVLEGLHAADLRLAFACSLGHPDAVAVFRSELEPAAAAAAHRAVSGAAVEEVVQDTTAKLLVSAGGDPPSIVKYSGRGRLSKWVQTVTLRLARSRLRKRTEEPTDDVAALSDRILEAGDPELEALKRSYRAQFKHAFGTALQGLTPRQRNLLRLELIDRATIDAIAQIHGVHAATISRWRADTRKTLLLETRRCFERELRVGRDEFQSIMRLIQSQLDVSLPRLLQEGDDETEPS